MTKRISFILAWAIGLYVSTTVLLGVASGVYIASKTSARSRLDSQTLSSIGKTEALAPMVIGVVALALGGLGVLPGTGKQQS
jgi:hypothetical protein